MSKVLINRSNLENIADAIRSKNGESTRYRPGDMAAAIGRISGGGYPEPTGTINITSNGTHNVKDYASASVNVQPTLQSKTATQNGTVTPDSGYDGLSSVVVNVSGGGDMISGTTPPTADIGSDGDYYKQMFPLPSGVNFVEFLQSSGTQYIDTGIYANQGTDVTCECEYRGNEFIIGCRTSSASSASKALLIAGSGSGICAYKSANNGSVVGYAAHTSIGIKCKSVIKTYYDGAIGRAMLVPRSDFEITYAKTIADFTADYSQVLFGIKQSSTPNKGNAKLYRVTYYQYGVPLADYLPCLDDNGVACMWDNVSQEYVYNDGTGDFAYGTTITPTALDPVLYRKVGGAWVVVG